MTFGAQFPNCDGVRASAARSVLQPAVQSSPRALPRACGALKIGRHYDAKSAQGPVYAKSALVSNLYVPVMEALQSGNVLSRIHKNTVHCVNKHTQKENVTDVAEFLGR
jgi:hypothetical protein